MAICTCANPAFAPAGLSWAVPVIVVGLVVAPWVGLVMTELGAEVSQLKNFALAKALGGLAGFECDSTLPAAAFAAFKAASVACDCTRYWRPDIRLAVKAPVAQVQVDAL